MCDCERAGLLISLSLDGEISAGEQAELDGHIAACPDCAEMLSVLSEVSRSTEPDAEPPETLKEGVMSAVREINSAKKPKRAKIIWLRWASVAAAAAIVSFVGVRTLLPMGQKPAAPAAKSSEMSMNINSAPAADTEPRESVEFYPAEIPAEESEADMLQSSLFMVPASPEEPSADVGADMNSALKELESFDTADEITYIVLCSVDNNEEVSELCQSLGGRVLYEYDTIGGLAVSVSADEAEAFAAALSESDLVLSVEEDSAVSSD